jgi:hypothetical protein
MTRYLSHVALAERDGTFEPLGAGEIEAVS